MPTKNNGNFQKKTIYLVVSGPPREKVKKHVKNWHDHHPRTFEKIRWWIGFVFWRFAFTTSSHPLGATLQKLVGNRSVSEPAVSKTYCQWVKTTRQLSHEKKTKNLYFPLNTGWLIGILTMVYSMAPDVNKQVFFSLLNWNNWTPMDRFRSIYTHT